MRNTFLIVLLVIGGFNTISAQSTEKIKRDSLAIDSMQKLLPKLKDTSRIHSLNTIAEAFLDREDYKFKRKCDSAMAYSDIAIKEATRSAFKPGIAKSLIVFCICHNLYSFNNRNTQTDNANNLSNWEIHLKQLLELADQLNDPLIWGRAYASQSNLMSWKKDEKGELIALQNALKWFKKAGKEISEAEMATLIGYMYKNAGNFEIAFNYFTQALQIARKLNQSNNTDDDSHELMQINMVNVALMYKAAGDYESSLNYLNEYKQLDAKNEGDVKLELIDVFTLLGQYDSAFYYLHSISWSGRQRAAFLWPKFGDAFLLSGNKDSALHYYSKAIDSLRKDGQFWPVVQTALMTSCLGKAKILTERKDSKTALKLVKESSALAKLRSNNMILMNCYDLQSQLFHQLGKNDSAYSYSRKYIMMKDSILTRQFLWRLRNYKNESEEAKKETRIGFLNRDNKIKEQQLKQEAQLKKFILFGVVALFLIGFIFIRNLLLKRKNEKLRIEKDFELHKLESEKKQVNLEMQALRAQMNPHFIFNCLSSINKYILKNEPDTASDYLTRFSRLIRMVLINSQKSQITLEDELEMLTIYLDIERLRFKNTFDYNVIFSNRVDAGAIYIPPLLLQPFCENAVWHGLKHLSDPQSGRHEQGKLDIILSMEDKVLNCIITDNGIGRQNAAVIKSKSAEEKKSLGLKITTERLALLNQEKEAFTSYEIVDLKDENGNAVGTTVKLKISLTEPVEEYVS